MARYTVDNIQLINNKNTVIGSEEDDEINVADRNSDVIVHIEAKDGNDSITVFAGQYTIDGGNGQDSITFISVIPDGFTFYDEESVNSIQDFNPFNLNAYQNNNGTIYFENETGQYTLKNIESIIYYRFGSLGPIEISIEQLDAINQYTDQQLNGTANDDKLYGGFANDTLNGFEGNDTLAVYAGNDIMNGGAGNDYLYGDDTIPGKSVADTTPGGKGNDLLIGGSGDDQIWPSLGDTVDGETGYDTVNIISTPESNISDSNLYTTYAFIPQTEYLYNNHNGVITISQRNPNSDIENNNHIELSNVEKVDFWYRNPSPWSSTLLSKGSYTIAELDFHFGLSNEINAGEDNDWILFDSGKTINGEGGTDTIEFESIADVINLYSYKKSTDGVIKVKTTPNASETSLINIESLTFSISPFSALNNRYPLQFFQNTISIDKLDQIYSKSDQVISSSDDYFLFGGLGNDTISASILPVYAGAGNDTIIHRSGPGYIVISGKSYFKDGTYVDGGAGNDTYQINLDTEYVATDIPSISSIEHISKLKNGGYLLSTTENKSKLYNIEIIRVLDINNFSTSFNIEELVSNQVAPTVTLNGIQSQLEDYIGPVEYLQYQLLGNSSSDIVIGSIGNDFFNLLGSDDAADGGVGDDVLDGGSSSNFLTGGEGSDTFFLDGRDGEITWSTITDFSGDEVNIWGWKEGVSKLLISEDNAGANGFTGATFHYDLNNDGTIDTSITFSGLTLLEIPQSIASVIEGTGYLFFS